MIYWNFEMHLHDDTELLIVLKGLEPLRLSPFLL